MNFGGYMKKIKYKRVLASMLSAALLFGAVGCGEQSQKKEEKKNVFTVTNLEKPKECQDNYRNYYEIFVYSFCDSDGDGIGDLNGVIQKLDYIKDMGFNGIWMMPIMPSTTYHKYDVTDYYSIDPEYGTLDDYKALLKAAKEKNIKIIIDLPINHTSAKNPWFTELQNYLISLKDGEKPSVKDCKYLDYYNLSTEQKDSAWYAIGDGKHYYEGMFWDQMPDLNLDSKEVKTELEKVMDFWLDMGTDGFRLDAVKEFYSGQSSKNEKALEWIVKHVKQKNPDAYLVAEIWENFSSFSQYYKSGIDSIFNYEYGSTAGKIISAVQSPIANGAKLAKTIEKDNAAIRELNPDAMDAVFINNHDNARTCGAVASNEDKMKMAGGISLMLSGCTFTYYGEEIGMAGSGKDENLRAPMLWSKEDKTGMTNGPLEMESQEQLFDGVDKQEKEDTSILNYYKKALWMRNTYPEIARGSEKAVDAGNDFVCAIEKEYEGKKTLVICNVETDAADLDLKKMGYEGYKVTQQLLTNETEATLKDGNLYMPAYAIVYLTQE